MKITSHQSAGGEGAVAALTSLLIGLLRENLEVEEPRLQPGQHEGGDGQHVAKGILGEELCKQKKTTLACNHRAIQVRNPTLCHFSFPSAECEKRGRAIRKWMKKNYTALCV